MRVLVATEARLDRTPDGACWNVGSASYKFWRRYLDVFDRVCVVARVRSVEVAPENAVRVDGPNVSVAPLPYYEVPWQFLRMYRPLRRAVAAIVAADDAAILRAPGIAASLLVSHLNQKGQPF